MAVDLNGTNQWLNTASPGVTAAPLTMACRFNSDSVTVDQTLMGLADKDATTHGFYLRALGTDATDRVAATRAAGAFTNSFSGSGYSAGTWHSIAGVYTSATNALVYLDGTAGTTDTTSSTPLNIDDYSIGRLTRASSVNYTNGRIADCCVWDVALTAVEVAAYHKGVHPLLIRPGALVHFNDLIRTINGGWMRVGPDLTNNNTATVAAHNAIIIPFPHRIGCINKIAAVGGGDPEGSLIGGKLLRGGLLLHGALVR